MKRRKKVKTKKIIIMTTTPTQFRFRLLLYLLLPQLLLRLPFLMHPVLLPQQKLLVMEEMLLRKRLKFLPDGLLPEQQRVRVRHPHQQKTTTSMEDISRQTKWMRMMRRTMMTTLTNRRLKPLHPFLTAWTTFWLERRRTQSPSTLSS